MDDGYKCPTAASPLEKHLCVHNRDEPPAQICSGDSGGPLIMDERGYGVVVGVTSGTFPSTNCRHGDWKCMRTIKCDKDKVGLFTNVEAYLPWIKNTTGQGYCNVVTLQRIVGLFRVDLVGQGGFEMSARCDGDGCH